MAGPSRSSPEPPVLLAPPRRPSPPRRQPPPTPPSRPAPCRAPPRRTATAGAIPIGIGRPCPPAPLTARLAWPAPAAAQQRLAQRPLAAHLAPDSSPADWALAQVFPSSVLPRILSETLRVCDRLHLREPVFETGFLIDNRYGDRRFTWRLDDD